MGFFSFIDNRFKRKHTEFNHRKFTIPVDNLSREEAEEQIKELMKSYKETIVFDVEDSSGEMIMNGDIKIPFEKDYWIPVKSNKK
jgi:uncharacterized FlaG/YvyC family protein